MPVARSARQWLAPTVKAVAPRLFWRRKYRILQQLGETRADVRLVASLCDPNRISLDIGADVGEFTIGMLATSRSVISFEPRPAQARDLTSMFDAVGVPVKVEAVALSDKPGVTTMRVVESEPGRSTIDTDNVLGDVDGGAVQSIDVPVKRLDDLHLDGVGLIKIDVEGHELAVLLGATDTLVRNQPALVVEAEERHHPNAVADITKLLAGLGYAGYFDLDGSRRPIEEFNPTHHQNPASISSGEDGWVADGGYVNNFVFLPNGV
ncbi:FkbM family methyltransferase [Mycobacterium sp. Aquia_213]|uniref:FkbM family methyltransferase n=1 Tax=Mycobacterium sp. Aquia_213 TaxID=2991728 RepID=UPI00226F77B5|nr:FkbM family methyltransferase [Mycobacterium sp. Aquia_213]WAC92648.1 FkbM family methyltransferase [Mycobacterium sp. Aquia_213]